MELVVFKVLNQYIKIKDGESTLVQLNKASVFPISDLNSIKEIFSKIQSDFFNVEIKKLVITEIEFKF